MVCSWRMPTWMDIHRNIHYYATSPLPFPWRFIASPPPFDHLFEGKTRENKGKTKEIASLFLLYVSHSCPTHVPLKIGEETFLCPRKSVERTLKGCWTGEAVDKDWICGEWRTHGKREGHIAVSTTSDCTQYLFGHARLGRFCKVQGQKEGTFARKNAKKRIFSCFFARLIVPLHAKYIFKTQKLSSTHRYDKL